MNQDQAGMIKMSDVQMWIGELVIENKMLHSELIRLRQELEQIKIEALNNNASIKEKEKKETTNHTMNN